MQDLIFRVENGEDVRILDKSWTSYDVTPFRSKGFQTDPIGSRYTWGSDIVFTPSSGNQYRLSDGHSYLIGFFGIYQGKVPYRVEPTVLMDFMEQNPSKPNHQTKQMTNKYSDNLAAKTASKEMYKERLIQPQLGIPIVRYLASLNGKTVVYVGKYENAFVVAEGQFNADDLTITQSNGIRLELDTSLLAGQESEIFALGNKEG